MNNNNELRWTATPTTKTVKIEGWSHRVRGTGVVLFGNRVKPTAKGSRWLERRFETLEKALVYAAKQGVEVDVRVDSKLLSEAALRARLAEKA